MRHKKEIEHSLEAELSEGFGERDEKWKMLVEMKEELIVEVLKREESTKIQCKMKVAEAQKKCEELQTELNVLKGKATAAEKASQQAAFEREIKMAATSSYPSRLVRKPICKETQTILFNTALVASEASLSSAYTPPPDMELLLAQFPSSMSLRDISDHCAILMQSTNDDSNPIGSSITTKNTSFSSSSSAALSSGKKQSTGAQSGYHGGGGKSTTNNFSNKNDTTAANTITSDQCKNSGPDEKHTTSSLGKIPRQATPPHKKKQKQNQQHTTRKGKKQAVTPTPEQHQPSTAADEDAAASPEKEEQDTAGLPDINSAKASKAKAPTGMSPFAYSRKQKQNPVEPSSVTQNKIDVFANDGYIRSQWDKYDVDSSGALSREEFKAVYKDMEHFGVEHSDKQLDSILNKYNMLGDDKITFDEFSIIMLKLDAR